MHVALKPYTKNANFRLFIYSNILNIALRRRKLQIWNGYFLFINENVSSFCIAMKGLPYEHEVMKEWWRTLLFCPRKLKFSFVRLRHQIYVINGPAKRIHFFFFFFFFKKIGWCFVCRSSSNTLAWFCLLQTMPLYCVIQILRKGMNVTVTSDVGYCDFKFYLHYVNQVA